MQNLESQAACGLENFENTKDLIVLKFRVTIQADQVVDRTIVFEVTE